VARILIVGCGCHGRALAGELLGRGHVVRGTSRSAGGAAAISAVGAEGVVADPDRLATLIGALEHAGVIVVLLGSATGSAEAVAALHGPRLEALLTKLLDTTVRGVVYEACGRLDAAILAAGASSVKRVCTASRVPFALLEVEREEPDWPAAAAGTVERVLGGAGSG
jgi:uncharacterized protein YbjT (DUF2867 family)